jgi:tRNA pseudouridine55 synthase
MIEYIVTKDTLDKAYDFKRGVMLLVDKPTDWTSFDVVNKIRHKLRHHLQIKKIKVGHAGTLDPMATGLLVVCTGKYTKQIESLTGMRKRYTAQLTLGATTPSYDAESEIDATYPTEHITKEQVEAVLATYLGDSEQLPPMFSAIKIDGQPLYKLARKGKTIERKTRFINIGEIKLLSYEGTTLEIEVECSKGTYIRTLAYDIGKALDSGAYLSALRRTSIGDYLASDSTDVLAIADWLDKEMPFLPTEMPT